MFEATPSIEFHGAKPTEMATVTVRRPGGPALVRGPLSVRSRDPRYVVSEAFSHSAWSVRFRGGAHGYSTVVVGRVSDGAASQRGRVVFIPCPTGAWTICGDAGLVTPTAVRGGYTIDGWLLGQDRVLDGWRVAIVDDAA